jgi:hypothetical protein
VGSRSETVGGEGGGTETRADPGVVVVMRLKHVRAVLEPAHNARRALSAPPPPRAATAARRRRAAPPLPLHPPHHPQSSFSSITCRYSTR